MNTIKLVKKHLNPALTVEGVVLTMFDGRTNLSVQVVEEVKKFFSGKVHRVIIPKRTPRRSTELRSAHIRIRSQMRRCRSIYHSGKGGP